MEKSAPKASNGFLLEQPSTKSLQPKMKQNTRKPLTLHLPLAKRKGKYTGRVGKAANNLKRGLACRSTKCYIKQKLQRGQGGS